MSSQTFCLLTITSIFLFLSTLPFDITHTSNSTTNSIIPTTDTPRARRILAPDSSPLAVSPAMTDRFAESMGGRSQLSVSRSPEKDAAPGKLSGSINGRPTKAMPDLSAYRYTGVGASKPAPAPLPLKRPTATSDGSDSEGFEVTGSSSNDAPAVKKRRFIKASERPPRDDDSQESSMRSSSAKGKAASAAPTRESRAARITKLLEREDNMRFTQQEVIQVLEASGDDVKRTVLQLKRQWNESHREEINLVSDTSDGPTGSSSMLTGSTAASSTLPSPRDGHKPYLKKPTATTSYAKSTRPQTISPSLSPALPGRTFQIAGVKPTVAAKAQVAASAVAQALATGSKGVAYKRAISVSDDDGGSGSDGGYDSDGLAERMSTDATSWFSTCDKDALMETTGESRIHTALSCPNADQRRSDPPAQAVPSTKPTSSYACDPFAMPQTCRASLHLPRVLRLVCSTTARSSWR